MCSTGMNNYMMYVGSDGIYTHTVAYERDPDCPVCSAGVVVTVSKDATLQRVMEVMMGDARLGERLKAPSLSFGNLNLYMRGVLEEVWGGWGVVMGWLWGGVVFVDVDDDIVVGVGVGCIQWYVFEFDVM